MDYNIDYNVAIEFFKQFYAGFLKSVDDPTNERELRDYVNYVIKRDFENADQLVLEIEYDESDNTYWDALLRFIQDGVGTFSIFRYQNTAVERDFKYVVDTLDYPKDNQKHCVLFQIPMTLQDLQYVMSVLIDKTNGQSATQLFEVKKFKDFCNESL